MLFLVIYLLYLLMNLNYRKYNSNQEPCPLGMSGSFSILVNNTDTNNNNLKYYTVMKDGVWDENKIRQFFSEQKIVDKSEDDIESNKATINESYINNPSVVFSILW